MRWRSEILAEVGEHIVRLGLKRCPVCESDSTLYADPQPIMLPIGGAPWPNPPSRQGPEPGANVLFMVMVRCELCGHAMMFDSERFHGPDVPALEPDS
jgi:hypothetical protein